MTDIIDLYGDTEQDAREDQTQPAPDLTNDPEWTRRAAYHLRRMAWFEARKREVVAAYEHEIDRLSERLGVEAAKLEAKIDWHRQPLVRYHEAILRTDRKRKTIVIPGGRLTSRTPETPSVKIEDRVAFTEWARTNAPHLVVPKYEPDRTALTAALATNELAAAGTVTSTTPAPIVTATGEQIPGVSVVLGATTYGVRFDAEGDM